jgi:hypothetical protein
MFGVKMPFIGGFVLYIHNHDKHYEKDDNHECFCHWETGRETRDVGHET